MSQFAEIYRACRSAVTTATLVMAIATAAGAAASLEDVTIETGNGHRYILCSPRVNNSNELGEYVQRSVNRLRLLPLDTSAMARITFIQPLVAAEATALVGVPEEECLSFGTIADNGLFDTAAAPVAEKIAASRVVSVDISAKAGTLLDLSTRPGILCVDPGPIEMIDDSTSSTVIFQGSLFACYSSITMAGKKLGAGDSPVPERITVAGVSPNPFNPTTSIRFGLPAEEHVNVGVYSISGRHVRTLIEQKLDVGMHDVPWNGNDDHGRPLPSGVYVVRVVSATGSDSRIMTLIK